MNLILTHSQNTIPIFRELLSHLRRTGSLTDQLIDSLKPELSKFVFAIETKKVKNDSEASIYLYGSTKNFKYKKLKGFLKQFLIHQLLTISPSLNAPKLERVMATLNAEYAAFNNLHRNGRKISATYIGEGIIAKGIEYGFNGFISKIAAELVEFFSVYEPNKIKADKYKTIYQKYEAYIQIERRAQILYAELMNMFVLEFDPGIKAYEVASSHEKELRKYAKQVDSIRFHVFYYQILIFKYYGQKDFSAMDQAASTAYKYFQNLKHRRLQLENMFLRKRVEANLILNQKGLCKSILNEILINSTKGLSNWYNTLEIYITLHVHDKSYTDANRLFIDGKNHRNYDNLISITSQRWGLLEAYINFLQLAGVAPESPTMTRYRINKFINDTPQYSEDKKGRNIQLIIAQLLFYIIDKNWDKMEEKIDALQKYGTRYLRKNELFRSQVFIKMLLEIPKRMYHPQAIIRHTAKYRKRLEEMAPNIDLNGSTLEIIPYEHLWELIIQNIVPPKYTRKTALTTDK